MEERIRFEREMEALGLRPNGGLMSPRFADDPVLQEVSRGQRFLRQGDKGPAVQKIQQALIDLGFPLPRFGVDGDFGNETLSAVKNYQRANGLSADGIIGPITMRSMDAKFATPVPATICPWIAVSTDDRLSYVMNLLVNNYHYPVNGAVGIVGNLLAESGVLPCRIEGSSIATPMRSQNFAGIMTDFSPDEVMNRNSATRVGPRLPGIGLAQWTTSARRTRLFQRTFGGHQLGSSILFNMDAQVDYLVDELRTRYAGLNARLMAPGVTLNDASDDVVYQYEIPGRILTTDRPRRKLPRTDPAVQRVFTQRRTMGLRALQAHQTGNHELAHVIQQTRDSNTSDERTKYIQFSNGELMSPRFANDPVLQSVYYGKRLLRKGDKGPAVQKIQQALMDLNFPLPRFGADGSLGNETASGIM